MEKPIPQLHDPDGHRPVHRGNGLRLVNPSGIQAGMGLSDSGRFRLAGNPVSPMDCGVSGQNHGVERRSPFRKMKQLWRQSKRTFDTSILGFSIAFGIVLCVVELLKRIP